MQQNKFMWSNLNKITLKSILKFIAILLSAFFFSNFLSLVLFMTFQALFLENQCRGEGDLLCAMIMAAVILFATFLMTPFVIWFIYKKWHKKFVRVISYIFVVALLLIAIYYLGLSFGFLG